MWLKIGVFTLGLITIFSICGSSNSFGHGLGNETMPPVMIGDKSATLEVGSYTDTETKIQQITITLFETATLEPIPNTSFEVELVKGEKILFKNNFERDDGILIMNLIPSETPGVEILNQETFASFFGLASDQFNVQGEIFQNGGLYKFKINILAIEDFDDVLSEPIEYNLGISIPETTYYEINDKTFGDQEIGIRTYYDQITEFEYIPEQEKIRFVFPFEWTQETIIQSYVIHEEILVPKTFGSLLVSEFSATLNEIRLPENTINIDDFNSGERIIHLVVSQEDLQEMFENKLVDEFDTTIEIEVKPSSPNLPLTGITDNGQFKINLMWEPREIKPNSKVFFKFEILDVFLKDRPMKVPYELKILHENNEIFSKSDTSSGEKSEPENLEFFIPSDISGVIELQFQKLGDSELARLSLPIAVQNNSSVIPDWVKNTAGWWANNEIPDSAFVNAIQYLIKEGIMVIL
tara:strand:+ start:206 stop:1603 length:1398 start_codon:yes stop_codon:yes gene_type:complete